MSTSAEFHSNLILEEGELIVKPPDIKHVSNVRDPEDFITMMNEIESPRERLKVLFKSVITPWLEPTHEATHIRGSAFVGFAFGMLYGGLMNNRHFHQEYQRKHNASVFDNTYRVNRHFYDTLLPQVMSRGMKYGIRLSLLTTSAAVISYGSITYRDRLYIPDWLVGFTFLGGLSRLWLGPKAMAVGSLFGFAGGLIGYGTARMHEIFTGSSVTQTRLIHHVDWLRKRERERRLKQQTHLDLQKRYLDETERDRDEVR